MGAQLSRRQFGGSLACMAIGPVTLQQSDRTRQPDAAEDKSVPWLRASHDPAWGSLKPRRLRRINYRTTASPATNGAALLDMLRTLVPGDRLEIGPGRYLLQSKTTLDFHATAAAPIWIAGANPGQPPIITRPDARQNLLNVGERTPCRYLALQHLELTGGSVLIRFYDCSNVWLDRCHLHDGQHGGITINSRNTEHMFITRNHLHDFHSGTAEAMYLGANHSKAVMRYSVVALNHVHDCRGVQGDGIEVKQGSYHNWIVGNHVHDTHYPCIIAYGTDGHGLNVIERNICYGSGDNTMQVQGEAIVRNNLIMAARGAGLASTDHQGKTRALHVIHNTIVTPGTGAHLTSWNDRDSMLFANNAIYSRSGSAVRFPHGAARVATAGNVAYGRIQGPQTGFTEGRGLSDFQQVSWDGKYRDARPTRDGALRGRADATYSCERDLSGIRPVGDRTAGCYAASR